MAQFSMRVLVVKRSKAQSIMASAAYRAGEKLWDERQGVWHDFRHKSTGVIHKEMLFPANSPAWVQGISREKFWLAVDASESRRDAQTARDVRLMIPREIPESDRVKLVRDFVLQHFVGKGMVADVCWHNTIASDGKEQPHAHILLTMRPLSAEGFGPKSRHEYIADPSGRTHKDGRPVMIESNPDSWNSAAYYEKCREGWEHTANAALARAGSAERIDRRSLLARGLARIPQPYSHLIAAEYVGAELVSLDFGTRHFVIQGSGLNELIDHLQNGSVVCVQEFAPGIWAKRPDGAAISSIRLLMQESD